MQTPTQMLTGCFCVGRRTSAPKPVAEAEQSPRTDEDANQDTPREMDVDACVVPMHLSAEARARLHAEIIGLADEEVRLGLTQCRRAD